MINNDKGFSLTESLVGLAIGVLTLVGATGLINSYAENTSYSQAVSTRDDLIAQVKSLGASLKNLQTSAQASQNTLLKNCLTGLGCNSAESPLSLYYGNGTTTGLAFSGPAVGTSPTPIYYNLDGTRCTAGGGTNDCPFEVSTSFISQCPSSPPNNLLPPPTCSGPPDVIEIIYTIQQVPGTTLGLSKEILAPYKGTIIVKGS